MVDGWIILDKPLGLGSTQGVGAVKRCLREAGLGKAKVGHGGTLDPLATGVLPIAVGEATKLCGRMLDATKTYAFTVRFGEQTDTLDREGVVVATSDVRPEVGAVAAVVAERFSGAIEQVPPAYSAILIDGKRAYDLARKGAEVDMPTRAVTILSWDAIAQDADSATLTVTVSKGTYIRSLARDIALALGTVGHVTMLRRLRAGPFDLSAAISLDKLNDLAKGGGLAEAILPLERGLVDIPALDLDPEQARAVRQGRVIAGLPQSDGLYWARCGAIPLALVDLSEGCLKVARGFNLSDVAE